MLNVNDYPWITFSEDDRKITVDSTDTNLDIQKVTFDIKSTLNDASGTNKQGYALDVTILQAICKDGST